MSKAHWQPIETALRDCGKFVALRNEQSGATDIGHFDRGEWSTAYGRGPMTHWRPLLEGECEVGPYDYPVWANEGCGS